AGPAERTRRLRAVRGVTGGLVSTVPGRGGPRRLPAQRADRGRRIGDAEELLARRGGPAADGAASGGYDESRFLVLGGTLAGSGGCGGGARGRRGQHRGGGRGRPQPGPDAPSDRYRSHRRAHLFEGQNSLTVLNN